MSNFDRHALIGFITEIEASRDRAKGETRHQSEIFKKAREKGFLPKAMRKVLERRAMTTSTREELDEAIDLYEDALGFLAEAREAVSGGMSARDAAKKFGVPRGALGAIVAGAENAISEPPHDPETGEITELEQPGWSTDPQIKPALPEVAGDPLDRDCGGSIGARAASEEVPQETSGLLDVSGSPERAAQNSETADRKPPGDDTGTGETEGAPAPVVAITESCGGVESRHADDGGSSAPDADEALKRRSGLYPSDGSPSKPTDDLTAGLAPGPQDPIDWDAINATRPRELDRRKVAA